MLTPKFTALQLATFKMYPKRGLGRGAVVAELFTKGF